MKINKTVLGVVAMSVMAVSSVVYAQFSLINGGGGYGYGYGYGYGLGLLTALVAIVVSAVVYARKRA